MNDIIFRVDLTDFETFEAAEEYANETGAEVIEEIGGARDEFKRCTFCGEWFAESDLNKEGECLWCEQALNSHI